MSQQQSVKINTNYGPIPRFLIREEKLTCIQKMILIVTIDAWPCTLSIEGFSVRCAVGRSTIKRNLKKLLDAGFIRRIPIGKQEYLTVTKYSDDFLDAKGPTGSIGTRVIGYSHQSHGGSRHDQTGSTMDLKPGSSSIPRETPRETIEKGKFETYVSFEDENRDPEELAREAQEANIARKKISDMIKTGVFGPMTINHPEPITPLEFELEAKRQLSQMLQPSSNKEDAGISLPAAYNEEDPF